MRRRLLLLALLLLPLAARAQTTISGPITFAATFGCAHASCDIASGGVTNAMLAGSIVAAKLVGTDIATVGTVTAGTWNATAIGVQWGGTGANLSATGGASQVLQQTSTGGAVSVGQLGFSNLSGTIAASQIAAGTVTNAMLANSSITLGSTAVSLGATASTISGLTLSGGTLSGTTTLPGSGQITSAGVLGIGAAPLGQFSVYNSTNNSVVFYVRTPGTQSAQQATLNWVTLDDGTFLGSGAGNRGWAIAARGNAFTTAGQQNDLVGLYWNGSSFLNNFYFPHGGGLALGSVTNPGANSLLVGGDVSIGGLATLSQGELGISKIIASGTAPGAGFGKLAVVAGTTGGTCKLIMYAGTSTTPTTVIDNVGSGC